MADEPSDSPGDRRDQDEKIPPNGGDGVGDVDSNQKSDGQVGQSDSGQGQPRGESTGEDLRGIGNPEDNDGMGRRKLFKYGSSGLIALGGIWYLFLRGGSGPTSDAESYWAALFQSDMDTVTDLLHEESTQYGSEISRDYMAELMRSISWEGVDESELTQEAPGEDVFDDFNTDLDTNIQEEIYETEDLAVVSTTFTVTGDESGTETLTRGTLHATDDGDWAIIYAEPIVQF